MNFSIHRSTVLVALQVALTALVAYLVGFYTTSTPDAANASIGGLWAAISGIVVLQASRRETFAMATLRILGSAIGSLVSAAYLFLLPFSSWGMGLCIFITVVLCHLVQIPDHARLASLTVAIVMVVAGNSPHLSPAVNAGLRFAESAIGTATAMFAILIWEKGAEPRDKSG
ncbi:membrane protein-like protein [Gloeomargarita lithophora Alchichica-D10]|uniref:Membrane protein-like protein n=1 Tax=Gloeomargarita lithophora Alchichica-D10 TaxID=1188229 RepID=A0A1J0AB00_9CYAN|nr:FUSC family protein [Gloeomargarita lithophora]APB33102.1 membrane protein-like protein [Gloeomargarita lithophora Alchichica-D10]